MRLHHEKKSDGVRVHHERSDGVRVLYEKKTMRKKQWGESDGVMG